MRKLAFIAVLALAACATVPPIGPGPDWRTYKASGPYTLRIPPDMVQVAMTPIDSAVDHLTSDGLRLNLDYGHYGCGVMGRQPGDVHNVSTAVIDGRRAEIDRYTTTPNDIGEFSERLYAQVPGFASECLAVHAMCRTPHDCDIARAIVQSVDFDPQAG